AVALLTWFLGLALLPLAQATALNFSSVIFATLGAALLLKEKVGRARWLAVGLGFVGVLVVLRPDLSLEAGSLGVLLSSLFWALSLLWAKRLTAKESALTVVFYMAVFTASFSLPAALFVWQGPTWAQLGLLTVIGGLGTAGYLFLTQALKEAEASLV